MQKKLLTIAFSLSISLFLCLAAEAETRELKVACNLPLTGELATYGVAVQEGVQMAVSETASSGVSFDWQDNQSSGRQTVSALRLQLLANPDIYVSGVRPQTMTIWGDVSKKGLPHFVWIFDRSIRNEARNNFRTFVSFKLEPPLFIKYAQQRKASRVAIVYVQLPHTDEEYQQAIVPGLQSAGIKHLLVEPYDLTRTDFKDLAVKVKAFNPDLIILSGFQGNLVTMIREFHTLRLIKDGNTISVYDMLDAAPLLPKSMVEGIRFSTPSFMLGQADSSYSTWKARFKEIYKKEPVYTHAYGYDMAKIFFDVKKRLGETWSREQLFSALRETNLQGITGSLRFDGEGDLLTPVELAVFKNGVPSRDD